MSVTVGDHASGMALDGIALDHTAPDGEDFARHWPTRAAR